jgi:hypothetical protein
MEGVTGSGKTWPTGSPSRGGDDSPRTSPPWRRAEDGAYDGAGEAASTGPVARDS